MLILRHFGVLAVATAAGAGAVVALSDLPEPWRLSTAYPSPATHATFETAAALAALLAAYLVLGRVRDRRRRCDVALLAALATTVAGYAAFELLPPTFPELVSSELRAWGLTVTRLAAGTGFVYAAFGSTAPLRRPGRTAALAVAAAAAAAAAAFAVAGLPDVATAAARSANAATAISFALCAALFLAAAAGFAARARREGDELFAWVSLASLLRGFASFDYLLDGPPHVDWIYTGDLLRLGFFALLVIGVAREIRRNQVAATEAARRAERKRVALDLHDGLAQELAFIASHSAALAERYDEEQARAVAAAARRALDESRHELRTLAEETERPLHVLVAETAQEVAAREGIPLSLRLDADVRVDEQTSEALVRVVREAVANAARHAGATTIGVELSGGEAIRLRVVDDGVGFDRRRVATTGRVGLVSMDERARALGGSCEVVSAPGVGTVVDVRVPTPA